MTIQEKAAEIVHTSDVNDLLFPVKMVDTSEIFGMAANSDYQKAVIATIDGQDKILNVCSERYELVPNTEIFGMIEADLLSKGVNFTPYYSMRNHAVFTAKYVIEDEKFFIGNGKDVIKPMISVNHSYNGLVQYFLNCGYYRMICSNGLVIPAKGYEDRNLSVKGKHTKLINNSVEKLFNVLDDFFGTGNLSDIFVERYGKLYDTKIENVSERVEAVMNAVGIKKGLEDVLATIRTEMAKLGETKANDWLVYNGINELIFDNSKNVKTDIVRQELDKKVLNLVLQD